MTKQRNLTGAVTQSHSVTEEALRFSFFLYDKVYNVFFRLLSPESPLFIFNHVAR